MRQIMIAQCRASQRLYGDWDAVAKSLDKLPKHGGLALGDGTTKDEVTGWTSGFLPFQGVD